MDMIMYLVVISVRRRSRHIMATVWQVGRVLHSHLMAVVMWNMPLASLHHRRLNVSDELSHFCCFLFLQSLIFFYSYLV